MGRGAALLHDISAVIEWGEMPVCRSMRKIKNGNCVRQGDNCLFLLHQGLSKVIAVDDFGIEDCFLASLYGEICFKGI